MRIGAAGVGLNPVTCDHRGGKTEHGDNVVADIRVDATRAPAEQGGQNLVGQHGDHDNFGDTTQPEGGFNIHDGGELGIRGDAGMQLHHLSNLFGEKIGRCGVKIVSTPGRQVESQTLYRGGFILGLMPLSSRMRPNSGDGAVALAGVTEAFKRCGQCLSGLCLLFCAEARVPFSAEPVAEVISMPMFEQIVLVAAFFAHACRWQQIEIVDEFLHRLLAVKPLQELDIERRPRVQITMQVRNNCGGLEKLIFITEQRAAQSAELHQ